MAGVKDRHTKRVHAKVVNDTKSTTLQGYVNEFAYRHNISHEDTLDQMALIFNGFIGKRLTFEELTG